LQDEAVLKMLKDVAEKEQLNLPD